MEDIEIKNHIPFCGRCYAREYCVFWQNFRYCKCWHKAAKRVESRKNWRFVFDGVPVRRVRKEIM